MGLFVNVYRSGDFLIDLDEPREEFLPSDCTMNGISSKAGRLMIVNVCEGLFDPVDCGYPLAKLVKGNVPKSAKIVPYGDEWDGKWTMFGGNYASSSDARWGVAVAKLTGNAHSGPVPIHDRYEG